MFLLLAEIISLKVYPNLSFISVCAIFLTLCLDDCIHILQVADVSILQKSQFS